MAIVTLNNLDTGKVFRDNVNANFTDLNGRTATIEADTNVDFLTYTPQNSSPTHLEGTIYYDSTTKTWKFQSSISGIEFEAWQMPSYIVNNSGVTIPKGSVVRHVGISSGLIQVEMALADTFDNALIIGVAGHDIANTATGYILMAGIIRDIDTSTLTSGGHAYLSDTVAGGMTPTKPTVISEVGLCLVSDAAVGTLMIGIDNNKNLPSIGAFYQGLTNTTPLDATTREFGNSTDFPAGFTATTTTLIDVTSGNSFKVPSAGVYRLHFTFSISNINPSNNGHIVEVELYNKTTTASFKYNCLVGRNDDVASCSFSANVTMAINNDVVVRYKELTANNIDGAGNIVVDQIQLAIESSQIR